MKKKLAPRPQLALFKPKELRMEDINWLPVFQSKEFNMIGLCNDPDRPGCYGKPVIVDPEAAPLQGLPYVAALKMPAQRELNKYLWQIEDLSQRHRSYTARLFYSWAVNDPNRGREAITPEAHFENRVRLYAEAGVYPLAIISAIPRRAPGEPDEDEFGNPIHDELTRYFHLDFVGKIIYGLEQHVHWLRQSIYYEMAVARDAAEQRAHHEHALAKSQKHWANVDELREAARLRRVRLQREASELVAAPSLENEFANQLGMFE